MSVIVYRTRVIYPDSFLESLGVVPWRLSQLDRNHLLKLVDLRVVEMD